MAGTADAPPLWSPHALQALASSLVSSEAGDKAAPFSTPRADLLESWTCHGSELAPVASVVGGVVANHVIRAVSAVNPPLKNLFFYSLFDNMGVVENMPV